MKFYEYKAHEIFRKYGIPVPRGVLATRPEEIVDPPLPCVVKAQVLIGGRGKAGGIKFAQTLEEARLWRNHAHVARDWLDDHGRDVVVAAFAHRFDIVETRDPGEISDAFRYSGAVRHPERERTGPGAHEKRIDVPVIAADELEDPVATGRGARQPERAHRGLGARAHEPNLLERR